MGRKRTAKLGEPRSGTRLRLRQDHRRPRQLQIEALEQRLLLAIISWTNPAGGNWITPGNWDLNRVPGAGDDVVIPDLGTAGPSLTVTYNGGSTTIQSLTSAENFNFSGGALTFSGGTQTLSVTGAMSMSGASLVGATVAADTTINTPGGFGIQNDLTSVTLNGVFNSGRQQTVQVWDSLVINGTMTLTAAGHLLANSATPGSSWQVTSPNGTGVISLVTLSGEADSNIIAGGNIATATIGSGVTVRSGGNRSSGIGTASEVAKWINQGTITAYESGSALAINGFLDNQGTITAVAGAILDFNGRVPSGGTAPWKNSAVVSAEGGTVDLNNTQWINTGTLRVNSGAMYTTGSGWVNSGGGVFQVNGGALSFGGQFTQASIGTVQHTGGTVNITGTLTGGLTLDATTGSWYLSGGTIDGGTITTDSTNRLIAGSNGFLRGGVTLAAASLLDMVSTATNLNPRLRVLDHATINGEVLVDASAGGFSFLLMQDPNPGDGVGAPISIDGTGFITMSANSGIVATSQEPNAVTFGAGLTLRGSSIALFGEGSGGSKISYQVNGPITVNPGGSLFVRGDAKKLETAGLMTISANATATIEASTYTNLATGTINAAAGSTISFNSASGWSNLGVINSNGATVNLGGLFTQANVGTLNRTGGTVNITGTLSGSLTLDANTGIWILRNGTIDGGTITTDGTNNLFVSTYAPGNLKGSVKIAAHSVLDMRTTAASTYSRLVLSGNLTVDGEILLGSSAGDLSAIYLQDTSAGTGTADNITIDGSGFITFGQNGFLAANTQEANLVTLASTLSLRGSVHLNGEGSGASKVSYTVNGPITIPTGGGASVDGGVKSFTTSGAMSVGTNASLVINSQQWTNASTATLLAASGSTLSFNSSVGWHNLGTIVSTGTVNLGGSFTQTDLGSFSRAGAEVNVTGTISGGFTLNDDTGPWNLVGATVNGGTIATQGSNVAVVQNRNTGYVNFKGGVRIATGSVLDMSGTVFSSLVRLFGDLTVDGEVLLGIPNGNVGIIYVTDDNPSDGIGQPISLSGSGVITFGQSGAIVAGSQEPNAVTLSSTLTLYGDRVVLGGEGSAASKVTYTVNGPISVNPGGSLLVDGGVKRLETNGAVTLGAGAAGAINAERWLNSGNLSLNAASLNASASVVENLAGGIWTGGMWNLDNNSTLRLPSAVTSLSTDLRLDGALANVYAGGSGTANVLANLSSIAAAGALTIQNSKNLSLPTPLNVSGVLSVGNNSILTLGGNLNVNSGGELNGTGTVAANVNNSGVVKPGLSPGKLTIGGTFTQSSVGRLEIEIAGTTPGSEYDQLSVTGNTVLAGTLSAVPSNGFGLSAGQTFDAVLFPSASGSFSQFEVSKYRNQPMLRLDYLADRARLTSLIDAPDLVAALLVTPTTASLGTEVSLSYEVGNGSNLPADGDWNDSFYLSTDTTFDVNDVLIGRNEHSGGLAAHGHYASALHAAVPNVPQGSYHVIMIADSRRNVPDTNSANNVRVSSTPVDIGIASVPLLTLGATVSDSIKAGEDRYYRLVSAGGDEFHIEANFAAATTAQMLVGRGALPTPADNVGDGGSAGARKSVYLPAADANTYYVLVRGLAGAGTGSPFTLVASVPPFEVRSISATFGTSKGNGQVTQDIRGSQFTANSRVYLVSNTGAETPAMSVNIVDSTSLHAVLDLRGLPNGSYTLRVRDGSKLANAATPFEVRDGLHGLLQVSISSPQEFIRVGAAGAATVVMYNVGDTDVSLPLFIQTDAGNVRDDQKLHLNAFPQGDSEYNNFSPTDDLEAFLDRYSQKIPDALPPSRGKDPITGQMVLKPKTIQIQYNPKPIGGHIVSTYNMTVINPSEVTNDFTAIQAQLRPSYMSDEQWRAIWANLQPRLGFTLADIYDSLRQDKAYFASHGETVDEYHELMNFEVRQANNQDPVATLAGGIDAGLTAPGISLIFTRSFVQSLSGRNQIGALGYGWTYTGDINLRTDANGNVLILDHGAPRVFAYQGTYVGVTGDPGTLNKIGDHFQLRESNGTITVFRSDNLWDYTQDTNGNRVTAEYSGGRLSALVHSSGDRLTLGYNGFGRIGTITDSAGRMTTYTYDTAGQHLLHVTDAAGTTSYDYITGDPNITRNHALESITYRDDTHAYFTYDTKGRLATLRNDDPDSTLTYTYFSPAGYSVTDAKGATTTTHLNYSGQIATITDPKNATTAYTYNDDGTLRQAFDVTGLPVTFAYSSGKLVSVTNQLGYTTHSTYDNLLHTLTSFSDARDDDASGFNTTITFTPDSHGNLDHTTYPDGTMEQYSYDANGNMSQVINRRTQAIQYSYNARGQVTRKDLPDGSHNDYSYDGHGNRLTATDAGGTITMTYDAADRMTSITYPDGRYVHYFYDTLGRRTRLENQDGFAQNYSYDAAGRLQEVSDKNNARIAYYEYEDGTGHLSRKDLGNDTFSTLSYYADGSLHELKNFTPTGAISSQFAYTYDAMGRQRSVTTLEGTTTYGYDAISRLKTIDLPNLRHIEYDYDAAGNRTMVIDSGVSTTYSTNNMNQYTLVGGDGRQYDFDGNLISADDGGGTTIYSYDAENRLIGVTKGADTWSYTYDALGNRIATTHNGQTTHFLVDPSGLGNVLAEYDDAGNLVATYTQGLGLTSRIAADSSAAYYDFDGIGSTAALTDAAGNVVNRYSYLPYGEVLTQSGTIANPYQYGGVYGVSHETNGLEFMRARFYSSTDGRFLNADPLGIAASSNLYAFANNNPILYVDPSGFATDKPTPAIPQEYAQRHFEKKGFEGRGGGNIDVPELRNVAQVEYEKEFLKGLREANPQYIESANKIGEMLNGEPPGGGGGGGSGAGGAAAEGAEAAVASSEARIASASATPRGMAEFELLRIAVEGAFLIGTAYGSLLITEANGGKLYPCKDFDAFFINQEFIICDSAPVYSTPPGQQAHQEQIAPGDPNLMIGPDGAGPDHHLASEFTTPLDYTVYFENKPSAEAAAAKVVVTEQLDADLDWSTFEFTSYSFAGHDFGIPAGLKHYSQRIDARDFLGVLVDVTADLDELTGLVTWTLAALDPETLDIPSDPAVGLLLPNTVSPQGEGSLGYRIALKPDLPSGTRIDAQSVIVFDLEAAIPTDPIFNTIDAGTPASHVTPLAATSAPSFTVSWSGSDDPGGAGIQSYNIYVSDNGDTFTPWLVGTALTSSTYAGLPGHTYAFYSLATDLVGHAELSPATPDASTTVVVGNLQVAAVVVGGTAWTQEFRDALQTAGLGNGHGYRIPTVTPGAQLEPLAWSNIDQIQFVFSGPAVVAESSLLIVGQYADQYTLADGGFSYDATTYTATWTLSGAIGADRLLIGLSTSGADEVNDPFGNSLDGDWANNVSHYPSGNGSAGGEFLFRMNVLPGDANRDNVVNGLDIAKVASRWMQPSLLDGDVTADLLTNGTDLSAVAAGWGKRFSMPSGDANDDGVVNGLDIAVIASHWLTRTPAGDVNNDGLVNGLDIAVVAASWPKAGTAASSGAMLDGQFSSPSTFTVVESDAPNALAAASSTVVPAAIETSRGAAESVPHAKSDALPRDIIAIDHLLSRYSIDDNLELGKLTFSSASLPAFGSSLRIDPPSAVLTLGSAGRAQRDNVEPSADRLSQAAERAVHADSAIFTPARALPADAIAQLDLNHGLMRSLDDECLNELASSSSCGDEADDPSSQIRWTVTR